MFLGAKLSLHMSYLQDVLSVNDTSSGTGSVLYCIERLVIKQLHLRYNTFLFIL